MSSLAEGFERARFSDHRVVLAGRRGELFKRPICPCCSECHHEGLSLAELADVVVEPVGITVCAEVDVAVVVLAGPPEDKIRRERVVEVASALHHDGWVCGTEKDRD